VPPEKVATQIKKEAKKTTIKVVFFIAKGMKLFAFTLHSIEELIIGFSHLKAINQEFGCSYIFHRVK
jgi:hypothetical protein